MLHLRQSGVATARRRTAHVIDDNGDAEAIDVEPQVRHVPDRHVQLDVPTQFSQYGLPGESLVDQERTRKKQIATHPAHAETMHRF